MRVKRSVQSHAGQEGSVDRRTLLRAMGAAAVGARWVLAADTQPADTMNIVQFEETLAGMRAELYRHPPIDILAKGFRPVGGSVADFCTVEHQGRHHFFYIERRLQEGTPFYPGHEIYFGHASTANLFDWEVHEPVMHVRPGTWEEGHVWAPFILRRSDEFVMAYTGLNRHLSQDIGLASSRDLFDWRRWETNPISPCKGKAWSFWRTDGIASCRDPHMLEHDGRVWMIYTANTKEGATCIALTSTKDLRAWEDHGPILVGRAGGYEPRLGGGHPQGSLESAHLIQKRGRWFLMVNAAIRGETNRQWIFESERMDRFDLDDRRPFWSGAGGVEIVKDRGDKSLITGFCGGHIRYGEVDWTADPPSARFVETREDLRAWQE